MTDEKQKDLVRLYFFLSIVFGGAILLWLGALFIGGVVTIHWEFKEFKTVVDYYSNIKGGEYIICVVYLVLFPIFYKKVMKS